MTESYENAYFLDSNIWIYALAANQDVRKHDIACRLIDYTDVVVSTQVINEVCINLIKKSFLNEQQIQELIKSFSEGCRIISFNQEIFISASELRTRYSLSFWDSLIIASALEAGASTLYSEDMQDGLIVSKQIEIVNPFK